MLLPLLLKYKLAVVSCIMTSQQFVRIIEYIKENRPIEVRKGYCWSEIKIAKASIKTRTKMIRDVINHGIHMLYYVHLCYTRELYSKVSKYRNSVGESWPIACSKARVMKHYHNITTSHYNWAVQTLKKTCEKWFKHTSLVSFHRKYVNYIHDFCDVFAVNIKKMMTVPKYVTSDGIGIGIMCVLDEPDDNHDVVHAMKCIIQDTNVSVFEFLIMDLNLTHLPILNHEKLIVERFKKLEPMVRDRCKTLNVMYKTHLIFKKVNSNFTEDCTNHILKYC